jgi:hypothetical protein
MELKTPDKSEMTGFCDQTKLVFAGNTFKLLTKM